MKSNATNKAIRVLVLSTSLFAIASLNAGSALATTWSCQPTEVVESSNRIHVRCSNPIFSTVFYAAIPNSSTGLSARFVALANAALLSGKIFHMDVPSSSATNTAGCATSDCRTPTAFGVRN